MINVEDQDNVKVLPDGYVEITVTLNEDLAVKLEQFAAERGAIPENVFPEIIKAHLEREVEG